MHSSSSTLRSPIFGASSFSSRCGVRKWRLLSETQQKRVEWRTHVRQIHEHLAADAILSERRLQVQQLQRRQHVGDHVLNCE